MQEWAAEFKGVAGRLEGMAVDKQGSVYVAGALDRSESNLLIKYDRAGKRKWVKLKLGIRWGGAISTDGEGNVYVLDTISKNNIAGDSLTIKYAPDGRVRWKRKNQGVANSMVIDTAGDTIVTGRMISGTQVNYTIGKITSLGV